MPTSPRQRRNGNSSPSTTRFTALATPLPRISVRHRAILTLKPFSTSIAWIWSSQATPTFTSDPSPSARGSGSPGRPHNTAAESFPLRAGKRDDRNGTVYLVQGGAVGGNYPDWWTATIARDLSLPHYSFLDVSDDKIELRSFGLATGDQEKGPDVEIDHYIKWRDEALPARLLSDLPKAAGEKLVNAIENLGAMCYAAAAHVLVGYLSSGDLSVCRAAALALERTADASVSDRLSAFLRDEDIVVRRRAARTLEAAMLPAMADKIVPQILDPAQDSQVRISLLGALLLHARDRALRVAMLALKAGDGDVRDRAADVVKRTATDNDVPILLEMCRSERRPYVAAALAWGLNRIKTQKGSPETTPP